MLTSKQIKLIKKSGYTVQIEGSDGTIFVRIPSNIFNNSESSLVTFTYNGGLKPQVLNTNPDDWPSIEVNKAVAVAYIYARANLVAKKYSTIVDVVNKPEDILGLTNQEKEEVVALNKLLELAEVNEEDAAYEAHSSSSIWNYKILQGLIK